MSAKVVIYGMGKIGRELLKTWISEQGPGSVAFICDSNRPSDIEKMLRYDVSEGDWASSHTIQSEDFGDYGAGGTLTIDGHQYNVYPGSDCMSRVNLPCAPAAVDLVIDCSGEYLDDYVLYEFLAAGSRYAMGVVSMDAASIDARYKLYVAPINHTDIFTQSNIAYVPIGSFIAACHLVETMASIGLSKGIMTAHIPNVSSKVLGAYTNVDVSTNMIQTPNNPFRYVGAIEPYANGKVVGSTITYPVGHGSYLEFCCEIPSYKDIDEFNRYMKNGGNDFFEYLETSDTIGSEWFKGKERVYYLANKTKTLDNYMFSLWIGYDYIKITVFNIMSIIDKYF